MPNNSPESTTDLTSKGKRGLALKSSSFSELWTAGQKRVAGLVGVLAPSCVQNA